MRTYVSTLGFHETRVTRPVLRRGLADGDVVVLVRPAVEDDDERGADAVAHVKDMVEEISPGATVELESINHGDFETAVLQCSDVLEAAEGELVVNFGGGAREVFLPLTIATLLHAPAVDVALQYTDVTQELREWEVPRLDVSVSEERRATLAAIGDADGEVSIAELDEHVDRSKSTVSRHVAALERESLVETKRHGQTKLVSLTLGGRLRLRTGP